MSLFSRKPKAVPLTLPKGTEALVVDVRVTQQFAKEISQVVTTAQRNADGLLETAKPPADAVPPIVVGLSRLTQALAKRWWPADTPDRDQNINVVFERMALGAGFALTEQQQGRLAAGQVDPLVQQAIAWQQTALPDNIPGELGYRCMFALRAGYYLARVGEDATPDLVANSD